MSFLPPSIDEFRPTRSNWPVQIVNPFRGEELIRLSNLQMETCLEELQQSDSSIVSSKDGFHASIDVQQFKPEEITVKLSGGNVVTVEGKHEEKQDEHGYISRHFVRKYVLPEKFDAEKIQCKLSSDGVLNINAPKKPDVHADYREIPIALIGPVRYLGFKSQMKNKPKRLNRKGTHTIN